MAFFMNPLPTPRITPRWQQPPARLNFATHPLPDICTRITGTKPLTSELATPLTDTGMDLGNGVSVVFSVNPPSPVESELCSDDHEVMIKTWCTAGPSTQQLLGEDHAAVACTTHSDSATTHQGNRPLHPFAPMSSASDSYHPSLAAYTPGGSRPDNSNKKGPKGPRRSLSETNKKAELYKTELCISVHSGIPCKYGDNCQFAHSVAELQHVNRHPRYKTQLCTSFQSQGYCKYNDRCTFIHHPDEAHIPHSPSPFRKIPAAAVAAQKPVWPISISSPMSNPNSGTVTPVQQQQQQQQQLVDSNINNKIDRVRAMSDPCISYMNAMHQEPRMDGSLALGILHELPMPMDMVNPATAFAQHMDMANASTSFPQQGFVQVDLPPNGPFEFMNHQGPQSDIPQTMRRQRRMAICYPREADFSAEGGYPTQHRDIFDLLPHFDEHGRFDPRPSGVRPATGPVMAPWMMTSGSIWQPPQPNTLPSNTNANLSQAPHQVVAPAGLDDESEWATKLARYISTPQNDFEI
ncbi:hypothetical protein BGX33_003128 [Mortierella sp. NVP41]|nr:hypothetical protein BGX33_003128 [Mortierella sp. NVP41]